MVIQWKKKPKPKDLEAAKRAIAKVAQRENKSVEEVRADITEAVMVGWNNPDPLIRATWMRIPRMGDVPTPEEVVAWASNQLPHGPFS